MTLISVVIPVYKCSSIIPQLTLRLHRGLQQLNGEYEIIYVNDSSPECDWEKVLGEIKRDQRVKGINLSKNFGQQCAIFAGLHHTKGEWIVVMDGDLQDQPEDIIPMYRRAVSGPYDVVVARRMERQDPLIRKVTSRLFYTLFNLLSKKRL